MIEVWKASELAKLCKESGFQFSKKLGQNFLTDGNIAGKIVEAVCADAAAGTAVVEIGAGAGALTVPLAQRAARVIAVEFDPRAAALLTRATEGLENVEICIADFLTLLLSAFPRPYRLVGNLPYQITTPIIAKVLEEKNAPLPETMVFMVQKEVADRLLAPPGGRDYGAISVLVQYTCETERICEVSREVFRPRPGVDSAVIRLKPRGKAGDDAETAAFMFRLVRAGFGMRRKTLRNALMGAAPSESALLAALAAAEIDPGRRAETLSPRDFYRLAAALQKDSFLLSES
ncbi:MAG: 16S rRNA (adenine(1518)-N(6)/adenine(1519)-N(6))-dimethyltransferase RsmA [Clostridiales bacterium]|nr:16S rRNA (adenine(1518)-N(6)/adenine(1519)-N(6))-dimethyltransferase RsmA [Clostridiales bacterium]